MIHHFKFAGFLSLPLAFLIQNSQVKNSYKYLGPIHNPFFWGLFMSPHHSNVSMVKVQKNLEQLLWPHIGAGMSENVNHKVAKTQVV